MDDLAKQSPERDLQRMTDLFFTTARYEYLFWDMAALGETWPI